MKIEVIDPSAVIIDDVLGDDIMKRIELAGRTCYKSEDRVTEDSADRFIRSIIKRGHESVLEHEKVSVRFICDRGVSHEIVRHRIASYSQESTRYVNYMDKPMQFIKPCFFEVIAEPVDPMKTQRLSYTHKFQYWYYAMQSAANTYEALLAVGAKPEEARSVLPNSLKTELVMTANLREWRHFFKLRTAKAAHPQMRELTIPLLQEFKTMLPAVFDDIEV